MCHTHGVQYSCSLIRFIYSFISHGWLFVLVHYLASASCSISIWQSYVLISSLLWLSDSLKYGASNTDSSFPFEARCRQVYSYWIPSCIAGLYCCIAGLYWCIAGFTCWYHQELAWSLPSPELRMAMGMKGLVAAPFSHIPLPTGRNRLCMGICHWNVPETSEFIKV